MILSEEQKNVVRNVVRDIKTNNKRVITIGGYAGVGKSTITATLAKFFPNFATCAFTGKAASVMRDKGMLGAKTIHSTIYYPMKDEDGKVVFSLKPISMLGYDGFLVDEACLPYSQRIQTTDGPVEIGKIVTSREAVTVLSYNFSTGLIEPQKVTNWFRYQRSSKLLKVRLSQKNNREMQKTIRCTPNHQLYLFDGTKICANQLKVGDKLVVRGRFFNQEQRAFLLGSLLGDACIAGHNPQLSFRHGENQKDYLEFKYNLFPNGAVPCSYPSGYAPKKLTWSFNALRTDDLQEIHALTYAAGKKKVTREWLSQINNIGLSAWYMDDGHLSSDGNAYFHTEGYSQEENETIKKWLKETYNFDVSVYRNKKYFILRMKKNSSNEFFKLVAPWVHVSMNYKLPISYHQTGTYQHLPYKDSEVMPVVSIEEWKTSKKHPYVYDIEVENNHNYFANNVLVSNSMVGKDEYNGLLSFDKPIVFIGDHGQLEPVGSDVNVMKSPMYTLEQIHRNAGEIAYFAEHIRKGGDVRRFHSSGKVQVAETKDATDDIISNTDQIICAFNSTRKGINNNIRRLAGRGPTVEEGDRVICLRNNKTDAIFNGMHATVHSVDLGRKKITIDLDDGERKWELPFHPAQFDLETTAQNVDYWINLFDFGYCITAHKSQGSEWDNIVVYEQVCKKWDHARWAYTAASRAKQNLIWLCQGKRW